MGCDIHAHFEIKIDGKWHYYMPADIKRNYDVFSKMANVRNEEEKITPISEPKGLPIDIDFLTEFQSEHWGTDGHSHSFLTFEEIVTLIHWAKEMLDKYESTEDAELWLFGNNGYLFGNAFEHFKTYSNDYPKEIQDVRLVFWFDN